MLRKIFAAATIVLVLAVSAPAATWNVDKAHSSVGFSVRHMVVAKVKGGFNDFSGTVEFDGKNVQGGSVEMTVQMSSIDTDNEKRDGHLKSPDFFDAEKYPTMSFKSSEVSAVTDGKFQLTGILTLKGVSKEVTFDCEFNGTLTDPWGNERAGFSAETEIDRQDFNVSYNNVLDTGGLAVSNTVGVTIELELIKAKDEEASGK